MKPKDIANALNQNLTDKLFPPNYRLFPNLNDIYELVLAFYESRVLTLKELIQNGAYFARIGNSYTRHFLMCTGRPLKLPVHSSSRLKSFFEKNLFRTGYATHGLFPYRGKFHPQMIKGLINIMGLKPGDILLDPMMGSGTTLVEASLMGIASLGVDSSPFCRFMTQTKLDALTMSLTRAKKALNNAEEVFGYFKNKVGDMDLGEVRLSSSKSPKSVMTVMEPVAEYVTIQDRDRLSKRKRETSDTYNFLLLAYLDSVGYAERSKRKSPFEQFKAILERYLFVAEKIQKVLEGSESDLAPAKAIKGDARSLSFDDSSVDGIIFSPPYSFAIDYLKNDAVHLNYLGIQIDRLRDSMIGLRGRTLSAKYDAYKEDMEEVLKECSRVLRPGRICTIIIGTNNNQLGKILNTPPEDVPGLHEILIETASRHDFKLIKKISRPITGISNTMRREYIVMLQKG